MKKVIIYEIYSGGTYAYAMAKTGQPIMYSEREVDENEILEKNGAFNIRSKTYEMMLYYARTWILDPEKREKLIFKKYGEGE